MLQSSSGRLSPGWRLKYCSWNVGKLSFQSQRWYIRELSFLFMQEPIEKQPLRQQFNHQQLGGGLQTMTGLLGLTTRSSSTQRWEWIKLFGQDAILYQHALFSSMHSFLLPTAKVGPLQVYSRRHLYPGWTLCVNTVLHLGQEPGHIWTTLSYLLWADICGSPIVLYSSWMWPVLLLSRKAKKLDYDGAWMYNPLWITTCSWLF